MVENIEKRKCTGCKMCADICPHSAIYYECDHEGFWYPKVDKEKCTNCGICVKRCPALNEINVNNDKPDVYAAWSKDDDVRMSSTSGGVFWEIASSFIELGGVVVGSRYCNDWKSAKHIIAHNQEELLTIKGSKYFQSDTSGIYDEIKKELMTGRKVLFCGTPCQNAALHLYLNKEYEGLYYMDFICRSVNSPLAFSEYICELEKEYDSEVIEVHLKNKDNGWQSLASQVKFANGKQSIKDKNTDWWVRGFLRHDLYTRDSCYHCKYKVLPRITADISIGDFWGIKGQSTSDMFKGISVIMLNTKRGKELFELSKEGLQIQKSTLEDVLPGNPALLYNPVRSKRQDRFFKLLNNYPFSYCVKKCSNDDIFTKLNKGLKKILRVLKKIIGMIVRNEISIPKYIYYNYLCKNIIRIDGSKVIPHKGTVINLDNNAKIYLKGNDLEIGYNKLKGSKSETHIRMNSGAIWRCDNGATLFYDTVIEIKENAVFSTGYFSANGGSVIIVDKEVVFGDDVMIGRNVIIYDSDFHQLRNKENMPVNPPKSVIIGDHVWLTSNITVLKGVKIGKNSLVTAQTVINKDVPEQCIIAGKASGTVIKDYVNWNRERCIKE